MKVPLTIECSGFRMMKVKVKVKVKKKVKVKMKVKVIPSQPPVFP